MCNWVYILNKIMYTSVNRTSTYLSFINVTLSKPITTQIRKAYIKNFFVSYFKHICKVHYHKPRFIIYYWIITIQFMTSYNVTHKVTNAPSWNQIKNKSYFEMTIFKCSIYFKHILRNIYETLRDLIFLSTVSNT